MADRTEQFNTAAARNQPATVKAPRPTADEVREQQTRMAERRPVTQWNSSGLEKKH